MRKFYGHINFDTMNVMKFGIFGKHQSMIMHWLNPDNQVKQKKTNPIEMTLTLIVFKKDN